LLIHLLVCTHYGKKTPWLFQNIDPDVVHYLTLTPMSYIT